MAENLSYFYNKNTLLSNALRDLWQQNAEWTRSYIISSSEQLPDLQNVTNRLFENPADFARLFETYYGSETASTIQSLFSQHLRIAENLINAIKIGNLEVVNNSEEEWYKNANAIATFLSQINPYWSFASWLSLLDDYLKLTENEAIYRISDNYDQDINAYDALENIARQMADYMAMGIINQYFS